SRATPSGKITWVDRVSLGNRALSTTATRQPPRARRMARQDPAQRAPTTTASNVAPDPLLAGPSRTVASLMARVWFSRVEVVLRAGVAPRLRSGRSSTIAAGRRSGRVRRRRRRAGHRPHRSGPGRRVLVPTRAVPPHGATAAGGPRRR